LRHHLIPAVSLHETFIHRQPCGASRLWRRDFCVPLKTGRHWRQSSAGRQLWSWGRGKNIKNVHSQKFSKLKLYQYNKSKIIRKQKHKRLPYITSFIPQNHEHLPFPLPHSFLKIISTYNISTSFIFSKSSQSIHHTLIHFHKIITTNHVIISFIPLNHNHLSYFTSSVFRNHNSQYVITSSILHPKAKQPNKTKKKQTKQRTTQRTKQ